MNTRPVIETSSNPVALSASFNQDASCFAVGLDTGFCSMNLQIRLPCSQRLKSQQYLIRNHASCVFLEVNATMPTYFRMLIRIDFNAGIAAVQMLGKANFIALIGGGKQPKFPQNKVGHSVISKGFCVDDSSR